MKVVNKIHIQSASFFWAISWLSHIAGFRNFGHGFFRATSFPNRPIQTRSSLFAGSNSNARFAWFWAFTPFAPFAPCCNLIKIGCSSKDLKLKSEICLIKLRSRIFLGSGFFILKRIKKSRGSAYPWNQNLKSKYPGIRNFFLGNFMFRIKDFSNLKNFHRCYSRFFKYRDFNFWDSGFFLTSEIHPRVFLRISGINLKFTGLRIVNFRISCKFLSHRSRFSSVICKLHKIT